MRITNWHLKSGMKSRGVALSILFLFTFSFHSLSGIVQDEELYSAKQSLLFQKDHSFSNSDSTVTELDKGKWKRENKSLILTGMINDTTSISDTLIICYESENRLSFQKGNNFYTYKSKKETPRNYTSNILKGIMGMVALILIGFLFSSDRKSINWSLVIKGILLQAVLALLILKAPYVEGLFEWISSKFVRV